jgi:SOS-response transcriptional repressor LexA
MIDRMRGDHDRTMLDRVDELLRRHGLSDREASIRAVDKPDLIRDMRRGKNPSAERLARLADVLETTPDYLLGRGSSQMPETNVRSPSASEGSPLTFSQLARDFPVYGTALAADLDLERITRGGDLMAIEQTAVDMTSAVDFIRRPPRLADNRDAYALIVVGESMWPRHRDGDTIIVDPRRTPGIGDDVVLQLMSGEDVEGSDVNGAVVKVLLKTLVRRTSAYIELEQYNPAGRFQIPAELVKSMHRVAPWSEMMSV